MKPIYTRFSPTVTRPGRRDIPIVRENNFFSAIEPGQEKIYEDECEICFKKTLPPLLAKIIDESPTTYGDLLREGEKIIPNKIICYPKPECEQKKQKKRRKKDPPPRPPIRTCIPSFFANLNETDDYIFYTASGLISYQPVYSGQTFLGTNEQGSSGQVKILSLNPLKASISGSTYSIAAGSENAIVSPSYREFTPSFSQKQIFNPSTGGMLFYQEATQGGIYIAKKQVITLLANNVSTSNSNNAALNREIFNRNFSYFGVIGAINQNTGENYFSNECSLVSNEPPVLEDDPDPPEYKIKPPTPYFEEDEDMCCDELKQEIRMMARATRELFNTINEQKETINKLENKIKEVKDKIGEPEEIDIWDSSLENQGGQPKKEKPDTLFKAMKVSTERTEFINLGLGLHNFPIEIELDKSDNEKLLSQIATAENLATLIDIISPLGWFSENGILDNLAKKAGTNWSNNYEKALENIYNRPEKEGIEDDIEKTLARFNLEMDRFNNKSKEVLLGVIGAGWTQFRDASAKYLEEQIKKEEEKQKKQENKVYSIAQLLATIYRDTESLQNVIIEGQKPSEQPSGTKEADNQLLKGSNDEDSEKLGFPITVSADEMGTANDMVIEDFSQYVSEEFGELAQQERMLFFLYQSTLKILIELASLRGDAASAKFNTEEICQFLSPHFQRNLKSVPIQISPWKNEKLSKDDKNKDGGEEFDDELEDLENFMTPSEAQVEYYDYPVERSGLEKRLDEIQFMDKSNSGGGNIMEQILKDLGEEDE